MTKHGKQVIYDKNIILKRNIKCEVGLNAQTTEINDEPFVNLHLLLFGHMSVGQYFLPMLLFIYLFQVMASNFNNAPQIPIFHAFNQAEKYQLTLSINISPTQTNILIIPTP